MSKELPHEIIHALTEPLARFLKIQAAAGILLLLSAAVAVTLTNSVWSAEFLKIWETSIGFHIGAFDMTFSALHWINDGLMTLFFFVVALEMKRELILGELRKIRVAALPLAGALGGMAFPALFYLFLMKGEPEAQGWGTVMATDTAFVIGCLALLGDRIIFVIARYIRRYRRYSRRGFWIRRRHKLACAWLRNIRIRHTC